MKADTVLDVTMEQSDEFISVLGHIWSCAMDSWLSGPSISRRTGYAYRRAIDDCSRFITESRSLEGATNTECVGWFWQLTPRDIEGWIDDLRNRPLDPQRCAALQRLGSDRTCGYSASTIRQYMAAVNSLFSYAADWMVTIPDGGQVSLMQLSGMPMNPFDAVERPASEKAASRDRPYLSVMQIRRFLSAIPQDTPIGLRDYALFVSYVMSGARNSDVRTLRLRNLHKRENGVFWVIDAKGDMDRSKPVDSMLLPAICWDTIVRYLEAVGRWEDMAPDEPIFTAISDAAMNLPTVSAHTWDPYAQPISAREVNRRAKMYASRAGLDPTEICVRTIRYSAAMLMDESGAGIEAIRQFLNHQHISTTRRYMQGLRGQRHVYAARMVDVRSLPVERC